jgi:signal transduction histidine kinase
MAAITLVGVGFFLAYFVIIPYMNVISDTSDQDRIRSTLQSLIWRTVENDPAGWVQTLSGNQLIREIEVANPEFRLYVKKNDEVLRRGKPPVGIGKLNVPSRNGPLTSLRQRMNSKCTDFTNWAAYFDEGESTAIISYRYCDGDVTLIEIGGISEVHESYNRWAWLPMRIWRLGSDVIIPSLLFLAVIGSALWMVARLMRRLAGITGQLDLDHEEHTLPVKGIPTEVLPLVTEINKLLGRLKDTREQQRFFLSAAAHELRTPLALLRVRLEDLPDGETKDSLRNDLRRMKGVVEQLLQLMSVKNRTTPTEKINLVKSARNTIADRALLALEQGVEITFESDVKSFNVIGDRNLLEVAIGNLVDNALDVSQAGDTVTVKINDRGQLTVSDNGPGVSAESASSIFEPFNKYPPGKNGHGLGLAIVKAIMVLVGGTVGVRNNPNGGALFELRFS